MQYSKATMPPSTQLELFSDGLKSTKENFNIFPGQHMHQTWTSLNHSGQFWRPEWEQIPTSNISKANWRCSSGRMVENSARDC
jgi:hypothetical protein